jgi:hypothetical protein
VTGSIFVLKGDDELVEMRQEGYLLEANLQDLLAKYPSLLAGDGINPAAPRRWLLVKKEAGLADREDAGARWSLDHLFLDQDAIPTLVEVKRSTDTRIRREVVGQSCHCSGSSVAYNCSCGVKARVSRAFALMSASAMARRSSTAQL